MSRGMDVIDRHNWCAKFLKDRGIQIRYENLSGAHSGLCRIADKQIFLMELSLTAQEQLEILEHLVAKVLNKTEASVA
ncbi:MAG: hypothetical protein VX438_01495 [Planctomycetota bacterium]|nr:hypothetical protein [Planctomycetota bacterium]